MRYFPYFRGRQFDLKALMTFNEESFDNITPIIEPVRDVAALPKTLAAFNAHNHPVAVVLNPQVGHYHFEAPAKYPLDEVLQLTQVQPAFILSPLLPPERLADNPDAIIIVQHYDDLKLFINRGWLPETATILTPPEARIRRLLGSRSFGHQFDHFVPEEYVGDDIRLTDSFFSDDLTFAQDFHEVGFSDFLTVGAGYSEHGFPTKTVTLHLTYLKDGLVRIHHFQSDNGEGFGQQRAKFFEALDKAVVWIQQADPVNQTDATDQLLKLAARHHFPGMGVSKSITINHHLAIMARYLNES